MSPLFYITDNAVRSTVRPAFPLRKKNGFSAINAARQQNRCNTRPDFPSAPLPASRKIRSTVRPAFPLRKKKRFSCNQPARRQTRCNTRPDFSSVPLPASRKIRLTVRSAFPLRKKTVFLQSTVTVANPLQYPSRLLFRASLRKPKNPVDSSSRFSSPKKNGFPAINRHGGKPVQ